MISEENVYEIGDMNWIRVRWVSERALWHAVDIRASSQVLNIDKIFHIATCNMFSILFVHCALYHIMCHVYAMLALYH